MKFELKRAKNGWILERADNEGPESIVGVEEEDEHESFRNFLWAILENYGPSDGKYSPKRIRVAILPGRDYEGPISKEYQTDLEDLRDEINYFLEDRLRPNEP